MSIMNQFGDAELLDMAKKRFLVERSEGQFTLKDEDTAMLVPEAIEQFKKILVGQALIASRNNLVNLFDKTMAKLVDLLTDKNNFSISIDPMSMNYDAEDMLAIHNFTYTGSFRYEYDWQGIYLLPNEAVVFVDVKQYRGQEGIESKVKAIVNGMEFEIERSKDEEQELSEEAPQTLEQKLLYFIKTNAPAII